MERKKHKEAQSIQQKIYYENAMLSELEITVIIKMQVWRHSRTFCIPVLSMNLNQNPERGLSELEVL